MSLDQFLDLSPSIYWKINWFKFDATCSQILATFSDDDPLSGFYYCLDGGLSPVNIYPVKERNRLSVEEPYPVVDDQFFDSVSRPSELDLFFDFVPLEEPFNWLYLESLTNHNHYIYCVFPSTDAPSA